MKVSNFQYFLLPCKNNSVISSGIIFSLQKSSVDMVSVGNNVGGWVKEVWGWDCEIV